MNCTKCGKESGKSRWCTACKQAWVSSNRERVAKSKADFVAKFRAKRDVLKDRPCADCGKKYHPKLMEFDHLPGHEKSVTIGHMGAGMQALDREVSKCDVVCLMCHRTRTHLSVRHGRGGVYAKRQAFVARAKDGPCEICGVQYPFWQMDFDHIHSKRSNLAGASRYMKEAEILAEIEKCRLLCGLCHRAYTFGVSPATI